MFIHPPLAEQSASVPFGYCFSLAEERDLGHSSVKRCAQYMPQTWLHGGSVAAIVVGNTLYIAGQEGEEENGKLKVGGIGPETQGALENLAKVVKAAGFELSDVVSVTVYLADIKEFEAMNKVYRAFMPNPKPTRATVQVVRLVNDARIEISAIAVKQP